MKDIVAGPSEKDEIDDAKAKIVHNHHELDNLFPVSSYSRHANRRVF